MLALTRPIGTGEAVSRNSAAPVNQAVAENPRTFDAFARAQRSASQPHATYGVVGRGHRAQSGACTSSSASGVAFHDCGGPGTITMRTRPWARPALSARASVAAWAVALVRLQERLVSFCGWHPGVVGSYIWWP